MSATITLMYIRNHFMAATFTHMRSHARSLILIVGFLASTIPSFGQASLHAQFGEIAAHIDGRIGVFATVLETGDTASFNADQRYPMQSVYKFAIAMAVLDAVDKGRLGLAQKIHVRRSDILVHGHSPIREKYPRGETQGGCAAAAIAF